MHRVFITLLILNKSKSAEETETRMEKVYSLEEIKDVQSKLVLIAGKADSGKDEVDQFVEVCGGYHI